LNNTPPWAPPKGPGRDPPNPSWKKNPPETGELGQRGGPGFEAKVQKGNPGGPGKPVKKAKERA